MNTELLTLGENRHATVTLADKLIVTDIDVSRSGTWFAVPKYNGTNANQITHVVYIVKPAHLWCSVKRTHQPEPANERM